LIYITLYFTYFLGHGAYFSALSPYVLSIYHENANLIFLVSQMAFPIGYFASGYLSDRLHAVKPLLIITLLLQIPAQYLLFVPHDSLFQVCMAAALTRFFFAFNFQLITIASIEGGGIQKFGGYRAYGTAGFFLVHLLLFLLETLPLFSGWRVANESAELAGRASALLLTLAVIPAWFLQSKRISHESYDFAEAVRITLRPQTLILFTLSFFFYFSYQIVDFYIGGYFRDAGGMSLVYIGWCLAVLLEIPFMPLTSRIFQYHRGTSLFLISTLVGSIRFAILSANASGIMLIPVLYTQILHGIHFTGFYMGTIYTLRRLYPDHLYGTGNGLFMIFAASFGGMAGNLFFGEILHGNIPFQAGRLLPAISDGFGSIFFFASLLQITLFFSFIFYPLLLELKDRKNDPKSILRE
jgi:PPP family 3-phenylpropionic acid transporter